MGQKRVRKSVTLDAPQSNGGVSMRTYASRDAFLICEIDGCKNVVADWSLPRGFAGPVICTSCQLGYGVDRQ